MKIPNLESTPLPHSIISVSRARRVLGDLAKDLDDAQVKEFVHMLHLMARDQLLYNGSKVDGILSDEESVK